MPLIELDRIKSIARVINKIEIKPMDLYNTKFYPEANELVNKVFMYFLTMVAIDHRLSRPGKRYRANINGEELHGSDLLYYLGMKMFKKNPDFFTPSNLVNITYGDVKSWLSLGDAIPPDPEIRTLLLQDLGKKIIKIFNGYPIEILGICKGYLRREDGEGLLDLLRIFKAYADPVEKKSMLLIKFLSYRGMIKIIDSENIQIPIDNHLTRIAIRLGLLTLDKYIEEKIFNEVPVRYDEDIVIRYMAREAYKYLSIISGIDIFYLDDFLWSLGRNICVRDAPQCNICVLRSCCRAYETKIFPNEHVYYNTWYY